MKKIAYPLIKPFVPKSAISKIKNIIESGWFTEGKYVRLLEERLKKYIYQCVQ